MLSTLGVGVDHGHQLVLALFQGQTAIQSLHADQDGTVLGHGPVTGLGGLDGHLHLLAQTRASGASVDLQLLGDAVVSRVDGVGADQGHLAQVQLVLDDGREVLRTLLAEGGAQGCELLGCDCHGQLLQRLAHANLLLLAQCRTGGADLTHGLHEGQQVRLVGEGGCLGPVGQVHGAFTGEAAVDFLAAERQQGRGNLRHGHQRGVEGVERVGVLIEEALAGATHVPVG